jgi:two-component system chemotaxis response regulator CheB
MGFELGNMPISDIKIPESSRENRIIAIGASTGGTEAVAELLSLLPPLMPGIVIVQHMPPFFTKLYAERLNRQLPYEVTEAVPGEAIKAGHVYIAPGDTHLRIKNFSGHLFTHVFGSEKVNGHCPSVDVLFESVAAEAKERAIGVILTGMGSDGARGLLAMRDAGAYTLGQDEKTSVVYGMPQKAVEMGAVVKQASLSAIATLIVGRLLLDKYN